jgi:hypothetical protein
MWSISTGSCSQCPCWLWTARLGLWLDLGK